MVCHVKTTSSAVNGRPSCHFTPGRPDQPRPATARRAPAATGRRGMRQRTSGASGYLDAGGVVGAGADGDPGAGGVAGADTGGASRTTDADRSPPRIASENEVRV